MEGMWLDIPSDSHPCDVDEQAGCWIARVGAGHSRMPVDTA